MKKATLKGEEGLGAHRSPGTLSYTSPHCESRFLVAERGGPSVRMSDGQSLSQKLIRQKGIDCFFDSGNGIFRYSARMHS